MIPRRLLAVALAAEGTLAIVGLVWSWIRHIPLAGGPLLPSLAAGASMALLLAAVYGWLLSFGPDVEPVQAMRRLYHGLLRPVFGNLDLPAIVLISVVAGVGEETLFRGVLQQEFGLIVASLAFGAAHIGGRGMIVLGAWAAATGFALGGLFLVTGGLIAPIATHALYDALALAYIRWGPVPPTGRPKTGDEAMVEPGAAPAPSPRSGAGVPPAGDGSVEPAVQREWHQERSDPDRSIL